MEKIILNVLIVADIHIKLGQRKVPKDWQKNRVMLLADEINAQEYDVVVIAGDLFDTAKPTLEEVALTLDFLSAIDGKKIILPGNHEMISKKVDCFLPLEDLLLNKFNTTIVRDFDSTTLVGVDIIPYNVIHQEFPKTGNPLAITHVRGEIPPHVKPEIDLSRLAHYSSVYAGDLHSKTNSQLNIKYPGSPFATSFHRSPNNKGNTGLYLVDTVTGDDQWIQLDLPELLRYKVSVVEDMVKDDKNVVIYELEGELEDLAKVKDSSLLDKKIANNVFSDAQLDLESEELEVSVQEYLTKIKMLDENTVSALVTRLREVLSSD